MINDYRVAQKIGKHFLYSLTYQILTDFRNYFTVRIGRKICNNTITIAKDPTTPQVCRYTIPCEMSVS